MEFTPMYFGIIPYYESQHHGVGGCLIEPHGFTSKPDGKHLSEQIEVNSGKLSFDISVPQPRFPVTLHEMAGISSSYLAQSYGEKLSNFAYEMMNFPTLPTFTYKNPGGNIATRETFVDAGGSDNSGVLALLRRKCEFIIACYTTNVAMDAQHVNLEDANVSALGHLAGLFGRQRSNQPVEMVSNESFNSQRQVFPEDCWDDLLEGLRAKYAGTVVMSSFPSSLWTSLISTLLTHSGEAVGAPHDVGCAPEPAHRSAGHAHDHGRVCHLRGLQGVAGCLARGDEECLAEGQCTAAIGNG
jgi:hypothetical protein